jgi:ankyrin repeat protein
VIRYLVEAGADPDAMDKSGVGPLHRAVRTRSSDAVVALVENGADPRLMNKSGSTHFTSPFKTPGRVGLARTRRRTNSAASSPCS